MKVSYIIPVYNTAVDKLVRCFESIKNSTTGDYEVIIINDGSSQNDTVKFCEAFCEKNDKYFKFYSFDNIILIPKKKKSLLSSSFFLFQKRRQQDYMCII